MIHGADTQKAGSLLRACGEGETGGKRGRVKSAHGILWFESSYFLSPSVANEAHNTLL